MRKKILICAFIAMLSLTGCGITRLAKIIYGVATGDTKYMTPDEWDDALCEAMFDSVLNRDGEKLKGLFCKKVQDNHEDLDGAIEQFFDFIDGEIISYDEPDGGPGGGKRTPEDGLVEDFTRGEVENIKTSIGKTYLIVLGGTRIYKEDDDWVGINYLNITDKTKSAMGEDVEEEDFFEISSGGVNMRMQQVYESEKAKITYTLNSTWKDGFSATVRIENVTDSTIHDWHLSMDSPNEITEIWNAYIYSHENGNYIIENPYWEDISSGSYVEFIFEGTESSPVFGGFMVF